MYDVEVLTPPAAGPVTAAELVAHLRLPDDGSENTRLAELAIAAVERFEHDTRRPVLTTTYRQYFSAWADPLVLGRAGATAIVAAKTFAADGIATSDVTYRADLKTPPARLYFVDAGLTLPEDLSSPAGYVDFTAGWVNAGAVPKEVLFALKALAGHWFRNPEAYTSSAFDQREVPLGWGRIINKYKLALSGDWDQ